MKIILEFDTIPGQTAEESRHQILQLFERVRQLPLLPALRRLTVLRSYVKETPNER